MSFNQVENIFLSEAIKGLEEQYRKMGGKGYFGLGRGEPVFMMVRGPCGWTCLTVAEGNGRGMRAVQDKRYIPVLYMPPEPQPTNKSIWEFFEEGGYRGKVGQHLDKIQM